MLDYKEYDSVFPAALQVPYDRKLQHEIDERRRSLDGSLFIDRVLQALGIAKARAYPPKSDTALRQLHQQICEAAMPIPHKQSLLYYILLDFDAAGDQRSASQVFASESGMPSNYQVFMKGLWHMDKQDYRHALEYLAHPSLSPDFADEIIITLVRHAPANDYSLALSYFYAVRPILRSSLALGLLFDAVARTSVTEALIFSRTHPQHTRELLFRRLISSVLNSGRGVDSSSRNSELAFMPLDALEEEWFDEYLSIGEGRNLNMADDTRLARKIACDRFADIGRLRAGGYWAVVLEGIKAGIEGRAD